jgi:hypothetical protein
MGAHFLLTGSPVFAQEGPRRGGPPGGGGRGQGRGGFSYGAAGGEQLLLWPDTDTYPFHYPHPVTGKWVESPKPLVLKKKE